MGWLQQISLNNIVSGVSHIGGQIGGVFGGSRNSDSPDPTYSTDSGISQGSASVLPAGIRTIVGLVQSTTSQPDTVTETQSTPTVPTNPNTHTTFGNIIAGIANSLTGGIVGNGSSLVTDNVSQAQATASLQSSNSFNVGTLAGHILNSALTPITGNISQALGNAVKTTPALAQIVNGVEDVAINQAQDNLATRATNWLKANTMIVWGATGIILFLIAKPFLIGKSTKSTKIRRR